MKKLKIISIWNPKGGQGKSLFAINIAAAAVELGLKPLVICQDPQGTSTLFYKAGNLPFEVVGEIPTEKPDANLVIFDHQASDWEVPNSPLLVMPLLPRRAQYATYADAFARAEKAGKEIFTVVTNAQLQRAGERATTEYLLSQGAFNIPSSGVFERAEQDYISIFSPKLDKAYKVKERRKEISGLLAALLLEQTPEIELDEEEELATA